MRVRHPVAIPIANTVTVPIVFKRPQPISVCIPACVIDRDHQRVPDNITDALSHWQQELYDVCDPQSKLLCHCYAQHL